MALVNSENVLQQILAALKKTAPPGGISVLSYKRNRGIDILWQENGKIWVRERGYAEREEETSLPELPRLLQPLLRYEFPRSRKIRLARIGGPEELDRPRKVL